MATFISISARWGTDRWEKIGYLNLDNVLGINWDTHTKRYTVFGNQRDIACSIGGAEAQAFGAWMDEHSVTL